jgi:hypothetical protein
VIAGRVEMGGEFSDFQRARVTLFNELRACRIVLYFYHVLELVPVVEHLADVSFVHIVHF